MNQPSITPIKSNQLDFDINKFNIEFEQQLREHELKQQPILQTEIIEPKKLHQYTIGELLLEYKNSVVDIIDDLVMFRFNNLEELTNIFLKNNRLLHIGITIILLSLFLYAFRNQ
jgi:hypothetical protein